MAKLLAMVDGGKVKTVIIAKLDRLTRGVKDLRDCSNGSNAAVSHWYRLPSRATLVPPPGGL